MGRVSFVTSTPFRRGLPLFSFCAAIGALAFACGDDSPGEPVRLGPDQAGAGGQAGAPAAGNNTGGSNNQGSAGSAGEAGSSGAAGSSGSAGAAGSGGAPPAACLEPALHAGLFTIAAGLPLCVTRSHPFTPPPDFNPYNVPTWGRHGGPLTMTPSDTAPSLSFQRWSLPADPTAAAAHNDETVDNIASLPSQPFFWGPAIDLPFFNWTLVPYTTGAAAAAGEVLLLDTSSKTVEHRHNANGFYSAFGLSDPGGGGHLFFTGLSPLASAPSATNKSAAYAVRSCDEGFAGGACGPGHEVGSWGGSSGPAAADEGGRGFFTLNDAGFEVRGFAKAALLSEKPGAGAPFAQSDGFVQSLAALNPAPSAPGYLAVDSVVFGEGGESTQHIDAVAYEAGEAGEPVKGATIADAIVAAEGSTVRLFGAGGDELWAVVVREQGGHWVGLRRKP